MMIRIKRPQAPSKQMRKLDWWSVCLLAVLCIQLVGFEYQNPPNATAKWLNRIASQF